MDVRVTPINSLLIIHKSCTDKLNCVFLNVNIECTGKRDTGIENRPDWSNGMVNFRLDRSNREKWSTSKGGSN